VSGLKTARWCNENINSGDIKFKNIISEVKELFCARSLYELKDEFGDVLYFTYCWLYSRFEIDLPMMGAMGSVEKYTARLDVWSIIFQMNGLVFHPKYLINGSNFEKTEKIVMALDIAREEQGNLNDSKTGTNR
jgi:hypothetical protein